MKNVNDFSLLFLKIQFCLECHFIQRLEKIWGNPTSRKLVMNELLDEQNKKGNQVETSESYFAFEGRWAAGIK